MKVLRILLTVPTLAVAACAGDATGVQETTQPNLTQMARSSGLVVRSVPDQDPGPPFYARIGLQFLTDGETLAIPFYRPPSCVPATFNLLDFFDFPGPGGPGAFQCPLLMSGQILIEPDAPLGTFPAVAVLRGTAVPFAFVSEGSFQTVAADGVVTMAELESMQPLWGTAEDYHETLHPRAGEHKIVIGARGRVSDGRVFDFHVTHIDDVLRSIKISIR